ncbi:uncharacterized protein LOC134686142 [Mytilus trossulus]|uniref:uncharacterized protein LOC134686142 n=1 Tax=Mytilus trossulus TaxID=6551 RepID=UPI003003E124
MEETTAFVVFKFKEVNYSSILAASHLNTSTSMPVTSTSLGDFEYNEFIRRWFEFSFMICLSLIGSVGNVHTILVYVRVKDMHERFHVRTLVTWLSVVDLITCLVVMPFETVTIRLNHSMTSNALCKLARYIGHTTITSSWLILTVIAHERYRKIYSTLLGTYSGPCSCRKLISWMRLKSTSFKHRLICTLVIISSLLISIPIFVIIGIEQVEIKSTLLNGTQCTTLKQYRSILSAGLYSGMIGMFGLLCFIYCAYRYWKILQLIHKQYEKEKRRKADCSEMKHNAEEEQPFNSGCCNIGRYKVTVSLIIATGLSFCSFILFTIGIAIVMSDSPLKNHTSNAVLMRSLFINNAFNPVSYFIFDDKFRCACRKLYMKQK